jgi:hypothetical protein
MRRNINLLSNVAHNRRRNITPSGWKTTIALEGFEQHGKAQTSGSCFVPKQIAFRGREGEQPHQFIRCPDSFHRTSVLSKFRDRTDAELVARKSLQIGLL